MQSDYFTIKVIRAIWRSKANSDMYIKISGQWIPFIIKHDKSHQDFNAGLNFDFPKPEG